jgi:hypothetical protein
MMKREEINKVRPFFIHSAKSMQNLTNGKHQKAHILLSPNQES